MEWRGRATWRVPRVTVVRAYTRAARRSAQIAGAQYETRPDRRTGGAARAQLRHPQRVGGAPRGTVGAVELFHEACGQRVLDRPQRSHHRVRSVRQESIREAEHAFTAQL